MRSAQAMEPQLTTRERLIVALDLPTAPQARQVVEELDGLVGAFKVGLQLFAVAGPEFVRELTDAGTRVFLDLKFHDIPNTVASASVEAARLGVWMMNVHASGGSEMMTRARVAVEEICDRESLPKPHLIGVTVLTSSDRNHLDSVGVSESVDEQVVRLARLTEASGLDGVVASPLEVASVRSAVARPDFLIVTPGIRSSAATNDDQKRVLTFASALAAGSDHVVVGRPITEAHDRVAAVDALIAEVESAG